MNNSRRISQYSIRCLLIFTAACSIMLGIVVNRVRNQANAVAEIEAANGRVYYDFQETAPYKLDTNRQSAVPDYLLRAFGRDTFHSVVAVDLDSQEVTDSTLAELRYLPALRRLFIMGASITDQSLPGLRSLSNLRRLYIVNCSAVDDESMIDIANIPHLEELDIQKAHVTDAGFRYLSQSLQLRRLSLDRTDVTEEGVEELQKVLPNCKIEL